MMLRILLLALVAPLAFGEYSYTYDYTDAPTAAPTTETMAPTRSDTYAPTRMTEAPSYAPTTETYAPTMAPTAAYLFSLNSTNLGFKVDAFDEAELVTEAILDQIDIPCPPTS